MQLQPEYGPYCTIRLFTLDTTNDMMKYLRSTLRATGTGTNTTELKPSLTNGFISCLNR
jgi:hypothetical protein